MQTDKQGHPPGWDVHCNYELIAQSATVDVVFYITITEPVTHPYTIIYTHTPTQRMATPICNADSWRKPLTAVQIAELQPEWDKVGKSNELLSPDAPPTQALPDRTQYYVSIRTPTGGITSSAVRYRSITAQRQANRQHAQHKRAIKNRDKLCPKRQLKLDIYVERVPMKYKAATYSKDSECAHQPSTIKHKDKLCSKKQLKLDIYVERVPTEYKAKTDSEGSKCAHQQCATTNQVKLCPNRQLKLDKYVKKIHTEYKAETDSDDSECDCPIRTYFIFYNGGSIPLHTPPEEHTPHCKSAYC